MKRKIYDKMLEWKNIPEKTALLIDGARRVGKSYIAEKFAKENYKSYILIDFNRAPNEVTSLFENYLDDLDSLFMYLSAYYKTKLYKGKTLFIFDEVQMFPKARGAIKYLVADGRYDFIETGSLMSIKKNVKDIVIPSEEMHIYMYPMDFKEFLWAVGDETLVPYMRDCFEKKKPMGQLLQLVQDKYNMPVIALNKIPDSFHGDIVNLPKSYSRGIEEFLYLIKEASIIVSSSFHGTAFALNFGKPLIAMGARNEDDRVLSLLSNMDMTRHFVYSDNISSAEIEVYYDDKIEQNTLNTLRIKSLEFLKRNLN